MEINNQEVEATEHRAFQEGKMYVWSCRSGGVSMACKCGEIFNDQKRQTEVSVRLICLKMCETEKDQESPEEGKQGVLLARTLLSCLAKSFSCTIKI